MKKKLILCLTVITSIFIVVGCSTGNDSDTDSESDNDSVNVENNEVEENNDEAEENVSAGEGLDVQEEINNVNDFYSNSYVPNSLKDEVKSDSMKISLVDGEVIYETSSNRLLKEQEDGDGMRTNAMSNILNSDGEIKDEDYFFQDGEEVADGAYELETGNILKWKKDDVYYALAGGRTKNSYSAEEGSTEIRPEDDRLEGYQDLVKVDNDFANLSSITEKVLIPEELPEGYQAVEIGYSYDPMQGYESYEIEFWIHYENEDEDTIYVSTYSGYEDMSESEMRNENDTIEGVEVSTSSMETKFIVDDVYYEIDHKDLERDEKADFIENLLKLQ